MATSSEHVLVIPRTALDGIVGSFDGFRPTSEAEVDRLLNESDYFYEPRATAEGNPQLKQLIPYMLLTHGTRLFTYRRTNKSAEDRLVGSYSLGVGGHISASDPNLEGLRYEAAAGRELAEEVTIQDAVLGNRVVGLINDDSDSVGQVHLGVVHLLTLSGEGVGKNESALADCQFMSTAQVLKKLTLFENWSRICAENFNSFLL